MKASRIIFRSIALLLLLNFSIMAYLVIYLDRHKELLELSASTALGREIRIEDGVKIHWSLNPSIALTGLWVGNSDWASGKYLMRAERVVLQLDVAALLYSRLNVNQVMIQNADIILETATDGKRNWIFGGGSVRGFDMHINTLEVEASHLRYSSSLGADQYVEIEHLKLLGADAVERTLETAFTYRDVPLSVSATYGTDTVSRSAGLPFKGRLTTGDAVMDFSGHMKALLEFADLEVALRSDRLDLPQTLSSVMPFSPVRQISARLKTSGVTAKSLLSNLSGEIKIGSARLTLPAKNGGKARVVTLSSTNLMIKPSRAVQLHTRLVYEKQSFQLDLTGGKLADLFLGDKPWKTLRMKAQGQFDKKPLKITGKFGPLAAVLAGRDLGIDLMVRHDGMKARFNGTVARFNTLDSSRFTINASGPDLSRLEPWLGVYLPKSPSFTFTTRLKYSERQLDLKNLKVTFGESDIAGTMSFPLIQGERIEGILKSDLLELTSFLPQARETASDGQTILLEQELLPEDLKDLNGAVRFEVGQLRAGDVSIEDVKLDATLNNSRLKLKMMAGGERLNADVDLKPEDTQWRLSLHHKGKLDIGWLLDREKALDNRSQAPLEFDVKLSGTGRSLAAVFASAEGHLEMVLGAGRLSEKVSRYLPLGSVLFTLLSTIKPEDKAKLHSSLECAVFQLDIADGIAISTRGLALQTDNINVLGGGSLNLRTSEIDLQFKTAQRKGLGISILGIADKFIRLKGTLQQPTIGLNVNGFLTHGTAAWATGGISLLYDSLFTRLTAFSNPCETVVLKAVRK